MGDLWPPTQMSKTKGAGCNGDKSGDPNGDILREGVLVYTGPSLTGRCRSLPLLLEIKNWRETQTLPQPTQVGTRGERGRTVHMEKAT